VRLLVLAVWALACTPPPAGLRVAAASSLSNVLPAIGARFAAEGSPEPEFVFDATPRIAGQLRAGASYQVLVSADDAWIQDLEGTGHLDARTRRVVARSGLAVVVPAGRPHPESLADLLEPRFRKVAVAGAAVPAGRYGRTALEGAGVLDEVESKLISGGSVRTVLGWVAHNEVDVGIVYTTDVPLEPRVELAFVVSSPPAPVVRYTAAAVPGAPEAAHRFLDLLVGAGQEDLRAAGFESP
jgi:molybdate transport system substrate-binding protein